MEATCFTVPHEIVTIETFFSKFSLCAVRKLDIFVGAKCFSEAHQISSSSDRISRHYDTRDLVFLACRSAALSPVLEAKGLSESNRRRPGDIFIPNWAHGSPAAVDVTLTCRLQSAIINRAAEEVGYACKLAEERKLDASVEPCQQSGFEFIPLALETSGGFGTSATSFLTVLAERCADNDL